jgi:RHS repeat-associated protein
VYDLFAYQRTRLDAQPAPAVVYSLARETHQSDLDAGESTRIQHAFAYSDGFGREIQKKIQAEPGPLTAGSPDASPRWVGSGWTVFNNKGKPVRQFEPFFTGTHRFEFDVRQGVSPILCYDPLGRVVASLHPNHTWQKVVFDPWQQATWDVSDTALFTNPADDAEVGDFFARLPADTYLPTWHAQRSGGDLSAYELAAATQTAVHAETPAMAQMDSLGRTFLTIAHNKSERSDSPLEESFQRTRVVFDIEGNQREVIDALERTVMRYDYDMLGNQVHASSMEAGERWILGDVSGQPVWTWDSRGHAFRTEYDVVRRPLHTFVTGVNVSQSDPRVLGREVMIAKVEYGEGQDGAIALNLRTRAYKAYDGAGVVTSEAYDFKGNLLRGNRRLASDYKGVPDWSSAVALEEGSYATSATYDAVNRPVTATSPDGSVVRPAYNEASLLERIDVNLRGETLDSAAVWTPFVTGIEYNARGQREGIDYRNGVRTGYTYDPLTFRLVRLFTGRNATAFPGDCPSAPPAGWPGCAVQDLHYTYDAVGNITHIQDDAQQTIYFRNQRVESSAAYTYDALSHLIEATGREHIGQESQPETTWSDAFRANQSHLNDGQAMRRYTEQYAYDAAGNILKMIHRADNGDWTRAYTYAEASLVEAGEVSNRLSSTQVGEGPREPFTYDAHGNMTWMPHLPLMQWSFLDQLLASSQQVVVDGTPETTWYVYDASGQRVRKVTERQATANSTPTRKTERIYLGGFEIYREYGGDGVAIALERETLHVTDDTQRVAMVETRTLGDDGSPARLTRYQFGNHLGSASLELDDQARIISYEEYTPYGSTSYQAVDVGIRAAAKRYRYTGMERDEETGLAYHGARYYVPWLGRWTSCDPAGLRDGVNAFLYVNDDPVNNVDPTGMWDEAPGQQEPTAAELLNMDTFVGAPPSFAPGYVPEVEPGVVKASFFDGLTLAAKVASWNQPEAPTEWWIPRPGFGMVLPPPGSEASRDLSALMTKIEGDLNVIGDIAMLGFAASGLFARPAPATGKGFIGSTVRPLGDEFIDASVAKGAARPTLPGSRRAIAPDQIRAYLPSGKEISPTTPQGTGIRVFTGDNQTPEAVIAARGLGVREKGFDQDLLRHVLEESGSDTAFRGATLNPTGARMSQTISQGAAQWGNYVYEIVGVPLWDIGTIFGSGYRANIPGRPGYALIPNELEVSTSGYIPLRYISRWGKVAETRTGDKMIPEWTNNPHYEGPK